ncbi:hypothetical protein POTOM_006458 [Populus tomentosa]|uniref:Retrotransposon Copia-like N-terminal domain-containing protein n=1 Tax=Populus tomentosa TaxID=118781 RepID=A0A8X8DEV6_POPTO|nr:hypothetical protein POTOM_006458 [Populus tomentosa]
MTFASSHSSSTSSLIGLGQTITMALTSSYQQLNHALPVKLDRTNYVLWKSQIDNIVFANGFEDFIDDTFVCPEEELSTSVINLAFITWRRQDRTILSWIYSSLTPAIMAKIIRHTTSQSAWNALEKTFTSSSRARIMQLRLELQSIKKGSFYMIDYIINVKGAADKVVEGDTMAVEDTATQASLQMPVITTTKAMVMEADTYKVEDIIQSVHKSHNVSYVANLGIQYTSTIIDLTFPIKTLPIVNAGNLINSTLYTRTNKVAVGNDTPTIIYTDSISTTIDSISLSEAATFPIFPPSSESVPTDPIPDSSLAPHMITRLMSGITKKKVILDLIAITEPYTLNQALKDPHWARAMD